ncbi:uncharacterized protein CTRU02_202441 [Colletotrichum truncatum]|uniref:Uncharacterized protein n=1 Tax=Colletotrichum truncatum TaxID=5467 RepID=A0ACC3ZKA2_COLTU|nr:uncharacterized protein CTRU02_01608 [Colletotrichum truncatum]KAF6799929.1 hypothetical protein CTRU02_01608 [Colletotrichum truncatum]
MTDKSGSRPLPIIYINGFPGTGKLTIAQIISGDSSRMLKLVHNHLLINPVEAVLQREQPGYHTLRRRIRSAVFDSLIHERATHASAYIFTDAQTDFENGPAVCQEYERCASERGCDFVPIILHCDEETNLQRLVESDRAAQGKLIDAELLKKFRAGPDLYGFDNNPSQLRLDVSNLSPEAAAAEILSHLSKVCPELKEHYQKPKSTQS